MNIPLFSKLTVKKRFPIEAIIWEMYKGDRIKHDRMRRVIDKDSGHEFYQFLKTKGEYRPMPFDRIIPSDTGLVAILASPASGQFFLTELKREYEDKQVTFAKFENNKLVEEVKSLRVPVIRPINESIRQTASVLHHRIDMRYQPKKSWFEKYGAILIIIVVGVAMAIPLIFYPAYLSAVTDKLSGINGQIQTVINSLGGLTSSIHGSVAAGTQTAAAVTGG
jgi:uncharacterized membrane protein